MQKKKLDNADYNVFYEVDINVDNKVNFTAVICGMKEYSFRGVKINILQIYYTNL